jgi:O-antigen/teichoic acid export membrane protein
VLIGRLAGDAALGIYTLGFSLIVLVAVVQDSLVTVPYTFFRRRGAEEPGYAAGALLGGVGLAVGAGTLAAVAGLALTRADVPAWLPATLLALGVTIPLFLLRDWARRYAFAHRRVRVVIAIDAVASALMIGMLSALWAVGRLSGPTAILALGVAHGLPAAVWLFVRRGAFDLASAQPRAVLARHWGFGRLDVAAQAVGVAQGYAAHWLLALDGVPSSAGILAACLTVTSVGNPIVLGVNNVFMARVADARQEGGPAEVWRVVRKTAALFAVTMIPVAALLVLFGGRIVALVYGPEFAGHGAVVAVLAVGAVLWAGDTTCVNGLRALDRPDVYLRAGLIGLAVVVTAAVVLIGLPGAGPPAERTAALRAASAIVLGAVAESVVQWSGLIGILRRSRAPAG